MQVQFDMSFRNRDKGLRPNHGLLWTEAQDEKLNALAWQGLGLEALCDKMGRSAVSITKRLEAGGLLEERYGEYFITVNDSPSENQSTNQPEATMPTPLIEKKVFINGVDGATLSDTHILKLILAKEAEVESWIRMKERPGKLLGRLAELGDEIKALSKYLDER